MTATPVRPEPSYSREGMRVRVWTVVPGFPESELPPPDGVCNREPYWRFESVELFLDRRLASNLAQFLRGEAE
jgi:hypothetical protein